MFSCSQKRVLKSRVMEAHVCPVESEVKSTDARATARETGRVTTAQHNVPISKRRRMMVLLMGLLRELDVLIYEKGCERFPDA